MATLCSQDNHQQTHTKNSVVADEIDTLYVWGEGGGVVGIVVIGNMQ